MGVRMLFRWRQPASSGLSTQEVLYEVLQNRLQCKNASDKAVEVKCQLLRQQGKPPPGTSQHQVVTLRDVWLVTLPGAQGAAYLVNKSEHMVIEADTGIIDVLEKRLAYKPKQVVQVLGNKFTKGDFVIYVGVVTQQVSGTHGTIQPLGQILEIEYLPLDDLPTAQAMILEFVELFHAFVPRTVDGVPCGLLDSFRPGFDKYPRLPRTFTNSHSAVQFMDMCSALLVRLHQHEQLLALQLQQQQQQKEQQQSQMALQQTWQ